MTGWVDSHCHLHDDTIGAKAEDMLIRARVAGVTGFLLAGVSPDGWAVQEELVRAHPDAFVPAKGAWGEQGSTTVRLAAVDEEALGEALTLALRNAVEKGPVIRRAATTGRRPRAKRLAGRRSGRRARTR